jgi:hypothetical protein
VNHQLARTVTTFVTQFRFTGLNSSGDTVFGPTTVAVASQVVLTQVPVTVVTLRIEYLGNGVVIGEFTTAVTVTEGGNTVLADPAWTDVAPGTAGYGAATAVATAAGPFRLAAADLNGDGNLDLVTANTGSNDISVLLGDGTGAFPTHTEFATGNGPSAVAAADLNGDGNLDLATANGDGTVSVLLGNGSGAFPTHTEYAASGGPVDVAAADLEGDGDLDLVTANGDATVSVLLGDGSGAFPTHTEFATGSPSNSVVLVDLDGDFDRDLATANQNNAANPDDVSVLLGDGAGGFGAATNLTVPVGNTGPFTIGAADLDGDGDLDLATAEHFGGTLTVFPGNGDGTFGTPASMDPDPGSFECVGLVVADLNGDNRPDLATTDHASNLVVTVLNQGDGTFSTDQILAMAEGQPNAVIAADLDGDGDLDLAAPGATSLSVFLNQ